FCAPRLRLRAGLRTGTWTRTRTGLRGRLLIKLGADILKFALQIVVSALDRVGVVAIDRVAHRSNGIFDQLFLIARDLVAEFFELLLGLISEHVGVVLDL